MTISVDWSGAAPWLITIPQSDLTLVSGTKYTITVDKLWELLRDFSDSAEAVPFPILYTRSAATSSTPAIIEIDTNNYTAQFEDGAYSVEIIEGNSNFRDVEVKNTVSVGTNNTTGYSTVTTENTDLTFLNKIVTNKREIVKSGSIWQLIVYDDDEVTPILTKDLKDYAGANITDLPSGVMAIEEATSV